MTPEATAIVELAETVKELVRIIKSFPNYPRLENTPLDERLNKVYQKATVAKNRVWE